MGLDIESLLISALAVIIGIVIHESAHALAAYALGDKTARSRGRVSLNPLNHIDPFGTILLPLLMIAAGGPVFAFAKPVPIYLGNLKHPKRDELLISLAGPASNIVLACLGALLLSGVVNGSMWATVAGSIVAEFALTFIFVNLSLAFFNLIPLPPLDGSSILVLFLKGEALNTYYRIQQYAMPILIVVLYLLPMLTGIDLIDIYFDFTVYPLGDALLSFALA
ncbi:site-2 protease family protein [Collinsella tanakaei]|uniref:site-2 protease family protein n=1 Tax=Collinsella tanakaei TaxID=626935 RepID=UPI00265D2DEE|nr:site-2 protease family protein [Collinsella tanakaei]